MNNFEYDVAIEEGDFDKVKKLYNTTSYSLYAKQMAIINKHYNIVMFIESHGTQRNNIGIEKVHKKFNTNTKKFEWSDVIPSKFRF